MNIQLHRPGSPGPPLTKHATELPARGGHGLGTRHREVDPHQMPDEPLPQATWSRAIEVDAFSGASNGTSTRPRGDLSTEADDRAPGPESVRPRTSQRRWPRKARTPACDQSPLLPSPALDNLEESPLRHHALRRINTRKGGGRRAVESLCLPDLRPGHPAVRLHPETKFIPIWPAWGKPPVQLPFQLPKRKRAVVKFGPDE